MKSIPMKSKFQVTYFGAVPKTRKVDTYTCVSPPVLPLLHGYPLTSFGQGHVRPAGWEERPLRPEPLPLRVAWRLEWR